MRQILRPAALIVTALWFHPALAQMMPGANAVGTGLTPPPSPRAQAPEPAPAALPGIGDTGGIATAPKLQKPNAGDPTTDLFTAINANNYANAQDAISRGANLDAQDSLGETPLDLSIALNHNNITFMILSARNEGEAPAAPQGAMYSLAPAHKVPVSTSPASKTAAAKPAVHTVPVKMATTPAQTQTPAPSPATDPGQANVSVGFLGFGQK